jgi:protein O-GlcNAc transferase
MLRRTGSLATIYAMEAISAALATALQHHRAGRLQAAEQGYRQVLAVEPNRADALHLLGVIACQQGQPAAAVEYIGRAIALDGTEPAFHNTLGNAFKDQQDFDAAVACYRRALELKPDYAEAHYNLGDAFKEQGKLDGAIACYRRALEVNPGLAVAHNNLGLVLQARGKPDEAVACYRRALRLTPNYAEAHNNLGLAIQDQGKLAEALVCYRRALELKPDLAVAQNNVGLVLQELGRLDEAMVCYRRALELRPDYAGAHNNLGNAFQEQGKLDEAVACYHRTLELSPDHALAHYNLGKTFHQQGKLDEAVACYSRALDLNPDYALAHNNLGNVLKDQGKLDEAVACYRHTLELSPHYAVGHYNLGNVLREQGRLDEALVCYRRALELKPDYAEAHYNLGNVLKEQEQPDEALACYRRALELKPDYAEAHNNVGLILQDRGDLDEADAYFRRALELKPDLAVAHNNRGLVLHYQGKLDEALACYRRALELKPDYAQAHSNLLMALQYHPDITRSELAGAYAEYDRLHAEPLRSAWRRHENDRDPQRRLRVGFVSPSFGRHPVGYFTLRGVENLDRDQFQTVCYSDRTAEDDLTARFRAAAALWRDTRRLDHEQLAEQIRADRIDILFDLAGHLANNRLPVFARKPAPIQVKWVGYAGSNGLRAMDYVLADRYEIPPEAEAHHCEKVLRMPDGYVCYDPPDYAPPVSPLPGLKQGYVTFSCFNNPAKINRPLTEAWAAVLRRLPQSRLVLKYRGMNVPSIAQRVADEFASRGIDPRRLECLPSSVHARLLAEYHRIDLAFDPFPYNGGLTTCEAMWMGVPVVTCPGETFAGRHSLSHLSNVGLTDLIAGTADEYVELAVSLAGDLPRLAALRAALRSRVAASPLCDGKRFAGHLMILLRDVWQQWLDSLLRVTRTVN